MLLTVTTTAEPATDLGFLLHKHPERAQAFDVAAGTAHVFYPRADPEECTAALLLEVDPVALVRGRRGAANSAFTLGQYVNDRPYAAGSLLTVALAAVFSSAIEGPVRGAAGARGHPDPADRPDPDAAVLTRPAGSASSAGCHPPGQGRCRAGRAAVRAAGLAGVGHAGPAGPGIPGVG